MTMKLDFFFKVFIFNVHNLTASDGSLHRRRGRGLKLRTLHSEGEVWKCE